MIAMPKFQLRVDEISIIYAYLADLWFWHAPCPIDDEPKGSMIKS